MLLHSRYTVKLHQLFSLYTLPPQTTTMGSLLTTAQRDTELYSELVNKLQNSNFNAAADTETL